MDIRYSARQRGMPASETVPAEAGAGRGALIRAMGGTNRASGGMGGVPAAGVR